MSRKKIYKGIDQFRWIAAILIITIHTSPLLSFWETGDFILTRIFARVGVPFFFMTSGFFLFSEGVSDTELLKKFLKKTAWIYGMSILLYLPVNLYNDYFSMDQLLPNLIRDLIFDGTMYHLWYLPASVLGAVIAWYLIRKVSYGRTFLISMVLYLIGLLGDSYYGLVESIPGVSYVYELLFQTFDYTRNGLFFAPLFFVMGGLIRGNYFRYRKKDSVPELLVSLFLMFSEGMLLHYFDLPRHDSMYVFLVPVMFFLFQTLVHTNKAMRETAERKKAACLREATLLVYIIHPMMIVAVRFAAKLAGLENYLIENSLIHFLCVTFLSVIVSLTAVWIRENLLTGYKTDSERKKGNRETERAWLEINTENLEHNVKELKKNMPKNCRMMAVVKAEAYGHEGARTALKLNEMNVFSFAVATAEEAIELRKSGVRGEILILGYTDADRAADLRKFHLMQTIVDYEHALQFSGKKEVIDVHLKIDTGMHRLGIDSTDTQAIRNIYRMKNLNIRGWYTHLCCADSRKPEDIAFTNDQIEKFFSLAKKMKAEGISIPKLHVQSSYGLLNYPEVVCDYVRTGISLYGVLSTDSQKTVISPDLRPVLSLKTRVVLIRDVEKGDTVGYGRTFMAARDSRIAILSVGYADGYPRTLSGGLGYAVIRGHKVPVAGRVCMDQLAVDITDTQGIRTGDVATLIGAGGEEGCPASSAAEQTGSISNELLSRLGPRLPRVFV